MKTQKGNRKGVKKMYTNLIGEIAKRGYTKSKIAEHLGINRNTLSKKLMGETDFSKKEFDTLHQAFFKDCSYAYLSEEQDTLERIVI